MRDSAPQRPDRFNNHRPGHRCQMLVAYGSRLRAPPIRQPCLGRKTNPTRHSGRGIGKCYRSCRYRHIATNIVPTTGSRLPHREHGPGNRRSNGKFPTRNARHAPTPRNADSPWTVTTAPSANHLATRQTHANAIAIGARQPTAAIGKHRRSKGGHHRASRAWHADGLPAPRICEIGRPTPPPRRGLACRLDYFGRDPERSIKRVRGRPMT